MNKSFDELVWSDKSKARSLLSSAMSEAVSNPNKDRIRKLEAENKRLKVKYMKEVYQRLWTQAQILKDDEEA